MKRRHIHGAKVHIQTIVITRLSRCEIWGDISVVSVGDMVIMVVEERYLPWDLWSWIITEQCVFVSATVKK